MGTTSLTFAEPLLSIHEIIEGVTWGVCVKTDGNSKLASRFAEVQIGSRLLKYRI